MSLLDTLKGAFFLILALFPHESPSWFAALNSTLVAWVQHVENMTVSQVLQFHVCCCGRNNARRRRRHPEAPAGLLHLRHPLPAPPVPAGGDQEPGRQEEDPKGRELRSSEFANIRTSRVPEKRQKVSDKWAFCNSEHLFILQRFCKFVEQDLFVDKTSCFWIENEAILNCLRSFVASLICCFVYCASI